MPFPSFHLDTKCMLDLVEYLAKYPLISDNSTYEVVFVTHQSPRRQWQWRRRVNTIKVIHYGNEAIWKIIHCNDMRGSHGVLIISTLDSKSRGMGSYLPWPGVCVVFLGKTLTLTVPLSLQVYKLVLVNYRVGLTKMLGEGPGGGGY